MRLALRAADGRLAARHRDCFVRARRAAADACVVLRGSLLKNDLILFSVGGSEGFSFAQQIGWSADELGMAGFFLRFCAIIYGIAAAASCAVRQLGKIGKHILEIIRALFGEEDKH